MTDRRKSRTRQEREQILAEQNYICALCCKPMSGATRIEYDHGLALGLGGADARHNLFAVHAKCHKKKTQSDVGKMRKADRQAGRTSQRASRATGMTSRIASRST